MEGRTDIPVSDCRKAICQTPPEGRLPTETIGSLMAECKELTQQIDNERERLERFMLETGGASDVSDRIQENIDSLESMLAETEGRLQVLFDAQEKDAFASEGTQVGEDRSVTARVSVRKRLSEKKAEAAAEPTCKMERERKPPGMDMER